jgi:hypothetical protein
MLGSGQSFLPLKTLFLASFTMVRALSCVPRYDLFVKNLFTVNSRYDKTNDFKNFRRSAGPPKIFKIFDREAELFHFVSKFLLATTRQGQNQDSRL